VPIFSEIEVLPKGEKMELVGDFTRIDLAMQDMLRELFPFN
jgi:uncharacterized protein (DUF2249 family)